MLPRKARQRLVEPLREIPAAVPALRTAHTLPIEPVLWRSYSKALIDQLRELATKLGQFQGDATFENISRHVGSITACHRGALSILFALEPFAPFDHIVAQDILRTVEIGLHSAAKAIEDGTFPPRPSDLWKTLDEWAMDAPKDNSTLLSRVFGLAHEPRDQYGEFKPGQVLEAYKYDGSGLINILGPHLAALGLDLTRDALVMTSVIGWIVDSPDPVIAHISMDLLRNDLAAASTDLVDQVLDYFRKRERARHHSRRRVLRTISDAAASRDSEVRALALADIHKRLLKGAVRQYGWTLHCLPSGPWSDPPRLNRVRGSMLKDGGLLRQIAESAMIVELRNGEAHEDIEWDGVRSRYLVSGTPLDLDQVLSATTLASSFERGCEAALIYHRATRRQDWESPLGSLPDGQFSMPRWERAEAYFGTNGLRALRSELNSETARIWVERVAFEQINPCFQALLSVHALFPEVRVFEVLAGNSDEATIQLSTEGLSANRAPWSQALETFDSMPIVTFLPANYDARSKVEPASLASRSAAWIAADGVLDALDSGSPLFDVAGLTLFIERLRLVETASRCCLTLIPKENQTRLIAVMAELRSVLDYVSKPRTRPLAVAEIDRLPPVVRIRDYWAAWGPVRRHPHVPEPSETPTAQEKLPQRRSGRDWLHL